MTRIQMRRDTSTNWSVNNPTPANGEPCYETDTRKFKIGDGVTKYTSLPYQGGGGSSRATNEYMGHLAMPSDKYIDLTLGASGATYNAPADGWVVLVANKAQGLRIESTLFAQAPDNDNCSGLSLLIPKNHSFSVFYDIIDMSQPWTKFRFYYVVGSEPTV